MAKKGKDIRLMITLECTEQKATGVAGISRYTSEKVSPRDCCHPCRSAAKPATAHVRYTARQGDGLRQRAPMLSCLCWRSDAW
jgi:hypothetical protein